LRPATVVADFEIRTHQLPFTPKGATRGGGEKYAMKSNLSHYVTGNRPPFPRRGLVFGSILCGFASLLGAPATAGEVDGFTEPYRTINVSSTEVGIIAELKVKEGDTVKKGQLLAALDNEVQKALLSIAQKQVELRGRLESAKAELELRKNRQAKIEELWSKGHARREEVERGRADVAIAEAQTLAAEEELAVRKLEHQKITVELNRRNVLAPIDGVVTVLHKEAGEFVAPTDPHILNLVQLDKLLGVFSVPAPQAARLKAGDKLAVQLVDSSASVQGAVESVSPVTDAESGTVRVKVCFDNPKGEYRSGQRCTLRFSDQPAVQQTATVTPPAPTAPAANAKPRATTGAAGLLPFAKK
jgi:RND family efflux transporter MFP subunit